MLIIRYFLLFTFPCVLAQNISYAPIINNTPNFSALLFSNSKNVDSSRFESKFGNTSGLGDLSDFRLLYGYAQFCPLNNSKTEISKSTFGIKFSSDQEGKFLSTNRIFGYYSRKVALGYENTLSLSISAGIFNINATTSSAGGTSASIPDVESALVYESNKLKIGVSINHLLNNRINSFSSPIWMKRYGQLFISYSIPISYQDIFVPFTYIRFPYFDNKMYWQFGAYFIFIERIKIGTSLNSFGNLMPMLGLQLNKFEIMFNYIFPVKKYSNRIGNQFDIGIGLKF